MDTEENDILCKVQWPEACPRPEESFFLSVSVGNTTLKWAQHQREDCAPHMFWRNHFDTMEEELEESDDEDSAQILQYLPPKVIKLFYPFYLENEHLPPAESVAQVMALRQNVPVTIYLISTNEMHLNRLLALLSRLPFRLYLLESHHFFDPLPYPSIGVDRVVGCKAALAVSGGPPVLVFDGGTALTHTTVDAKGTLCGGGIAPGLQAQLDGLAVACPGLPRITPQQVKDAVVQRIDNEEKPLQVYATDTHEAIIASVVRSIAFYLNSIVQHWQQTCCLQAAPQNFTSTGSQQPTETDVSSSPKGVTEMKASAETNSGATAQVSVTTSLQDTTASMDLQQPEPTRIFLTGQDATWLEHLLRPDTLAKIIETPEAGPNAKVHMPPVEHNQYLLHRGIQQLLLEKKDPQDDDSSSRKSNGEDNDNYLLGLRFAKKFGQNLYRGVVIARSPDLMDMGQEVYFVKYDDGDGEEVRVTELYDGIVLYSHVGEASIPKETGAESIDWENLIEEKIKASAIAAALLAERNGQVGNHLDHLETQPGTQLVAPLVVEADDSRGRDTESALGDVGQNGASVQRKRRKEEADSELPVDSINKETTNHKYVGRKIRKMFIDGGYEGIVDTYRPSKADKDFWHVVYTDGDEEEMDEEELLECMELFEETQNQRNSKCTPEKEKNDDVDGTEKTAADPVMQPSPHESSYTYLQKKIWTDSADGGTVGTVTSLIPGEGNAKSYEVVYTDGSSDIMSTEKLLTHMDLYKKNHPAGAEKRQRIEPEVNVTNL